MAVSPIVAGAALKGPADRLMAELGHEPTVVGVARLYADFVGTLVVDDADAASADAVEACGVRCVVGPDGHAHARARRRAGVAAARRGPTVGRHPGHAGGDRPPDGRRAATPTAPGA